MVSDFIEDQADGSGARLGVHPWEQICDGPQTALNTDGLFQGQVRGEEG